jgi:hypothetical protein
LIPLRLLLIAIPTEVWKRLPHERALAELAKDAEGSARRYRKGSNARKERLRFTQLSSYIETVALELWRRGSHNCREDETLRGALLGGLQVCEWRDTGPVAGRASSYLDLLERLRVRFDETDDVSNGNNPWPTLGLWDSLWYFVKTLCANLHRSWLAFLLREVAGAASARIRLAWRDFREACRQRGRRGQEEESVLPLVGRTFHSPGPSVAGQRRLYERLTLQTLAKLFPDLPEENRMKFALVALEKATFLRKAERQGAAVVEVLAADPS